MAWLNLIHVRRGIPETLGRHLEETWSGFFRWTEIQLQWYEQTDFTTQDDVKKDLDKLETRMTSDELRKRNGNDLNAEYDRLLRRIGLEDFGMYSIVNWPHHCTEALEDRKNDFLEVICGFMTNIVKVWAMPNR
jgi:hypothetical protein